MFSQLTTCILLACVLVSSATPTVINESPIKLPIARRLNLTGTTLVKADQQRAKFLKTRSQLPKPDFNPTKAKQNAASAVGVGITNGVVSYTAEVGIGNPPQTFNLLVDTGSSNTWAGAQPFSFTGGTTTGELMEVTYGSGFVFGQEVTDTLTLGSLVIENQSMGSAILSQGFDDVDGIIGLGPTDLTDGTTSGGGTVPTVTDNAFSQGLITNKMLGISFEPTTQLSVTNGELTFGGVDPSKFTGDINFVPITSVSPANEFVGIDQTVTYNGQQLLTSSGIVDTGTTLLLLATDAFNAYVAATGATADQNTGLLSITPAQFDNLQSLLFTIGTKTFEFTKNAQLWPRALNTAIGGQADQIFLIVSDLGSLSGEGLDFVNGMTFLERFFTVFDAGSSQFGIATTLFTDATSN